MRELRSVPPYEVLLLEGDPTAGDEHRHVIAVQTRDPDGGETRWAAVEVITALQDGERFVVGDAGEASTSVLEPGVCPACEKPTISVGPGGTEVAARPRRRSRS